MSWGMLAETVTTHAPAPAARSTGHSIAANTYARASHMSPDAALGIPAVYASVRLIASTIDQLTLTTDDGQVPRWLSNPRRFGQFDQGDLVQLVVTAMALRGRCYLIAERMTDGWRLDVTAPDAVQTVTATDTYGRVIVQHQAREVLPTVPLDAANWTVGGRYVVHIPYLATIDHPEGIGPLQAARGVLNGYEAVERQAADLLTGGTVSGGRLETESDITADTARRWREQWTANRDSGEIPVLGAGLRYVNDIIAPKDASWLESRAFNAQQIAQMYGIPTDYLGMTMAGGGSSLSYNNAADNNRRYRTNCLEAFTSQIGDALTPLLGAPGRGAADARRVVFDYTAWEGAMDADVAADRPADA